MVEAAGGEFNREENRFSQSCAARHKFSVNKDGPARFVLYRSSAIAHRNA